MAKTSTKINLKLYDLTAGLDAEYASTDIQPFVDITDLETDFDAPVNFATLEPDQWRLDGSMDLFVDNMASYQFGYWSLSRSNSLKELTVPLEITFDDVHSSIGLSLEFYDGDFATEVYVEWYDITDTLIISGTYENTKNDMFIDETVLDFKRIHIEFNKNNKIGHYVKLKKVGFGANILFDNQDIKDCKVLEEVNVISDEVSINTMSTTILLSDTEYIEKIYSVLEEQQQMVVSEIVNDVEKQMGTFYLKSKLNPNENTINFATQDLIGLMSGSTYLGGMINGTVESVINSIMASFGTTLYTIEDDLKPLIIKGYIPVTDYRRALQLIAFSIGAVIDCSRSNKVNIYRLPTTSPLTLSKDEFFNGASQEELEKITDVQLNLKSYEADTTLKEAYKVTHTSGTYIALFSEPFSGLSISNGTILSSNENYAQFSTTGGEVIISGYPYVVSTQTFTISTSGLPATTVRKTAKYENTIIYDGDFNVQHLYDNVIDLNKRTVKILASIQEAGDFVRVDALYNKTIDGYITSLSVSLTGGFLADLTISGKINLVII